MSIAKQIEAILDKRLGRGLYEGKGRLQQIEARINTFKRVKEKLEQLNALISVIQKQKEQQQGEYYALLSAEPEAAMRFREISCRSAKMSLDKVLEALQNLKLRFERNAIRIAFIGRERQGKSTFLKTITGLTDQVIPAYSGNSCTGAVSVIHNSDENQLRVDILYYTIDEFLSTVKDKLARFFPEQTFALRQMNDIQQLNLPINLGDNATTSLISEYVKFKDVYIDNYVQYCDLVGLGRVAYYDEDEIALHVAQYEEFDNEQPDSVRVQKDDGSVIYKVSYYKYVAVKSVDIYTSFRVPDTEMLELVDTIGVGSSADSELVEDEMYRVLREDCDAAIDLFRPDPAPSFPDVQTELLDNIWKNLSDRSPSKWIIYVVNKVTQGSFMNEASVRELIPIINNILLGKSINQPVAWAEAVDGSNLDEVRDLLINPLLELITDNLDVLDDNLMLQAEELVKEAFNDCLTLVKSANAVTSVSVGHNASIIYLFDVDLFAKLSGDFNSAMNQIDQLGYAQKRESKCDDLEQAYLKIIDNIDLGIPSEANLLNRLQTGAFITDNQLFDDSIEQMRSRIFTLFEEVNADVLYPLQEKIKSDLIEKLFEEGRMKYLPIKESNEPNTEWLQAVINDYIDEKIYPYLSKALKFILDYQISIEGMVEYNITRSLYQIDKTHSEYIRYNGEHSNDFQQRASNVWQELCNRLTPISNNLKSWISDFTLIPSHSFYSRVHKYHVKVCSDNGGVKDFRKFYCDNMGIIWGNEITNAAQTERAFGAWSERVKEFQSEIISDNFKLR